MKKAIGEGDWDGGGCGGGKKLGEVQGWKESVKLSYDGTLLVKGIFHHSI